MKARLPLLALVLMQITWAPAIQASTFLPWEDYLPQGVTLGMDYLAFSQTVPKAFNLHAPDAPITDSDQAFTLATTIPNDKPVWSSLRFIFKNRLLAGVAFIEPISGGDAYEQPIRSEMLAGFSPERTVTHRVLISGNKRDKEVAQLSNTASSVAAYCLVDAEVIAVVVFKTNQVSLADVFGDIQ